MPKTLEGAADSGSHTCALDLKSRLDGRIMNRDLNGARGIYLCAITHAGRTYIG